jgi:hypothetical protein
MYIFLNTLEKMDASCFVRVQDIHGGSIQVTTIEVQCQDTMKSLIN